jgi:hypothetical protein
MCGRPCRPQGSTRAWLARGACNTIGTHITSILPSKPAIVGRRVAVKVLGGGLGVAVDQEAPQAGSGLLKALEAKDGHQSHADDARVQSLVVYHRVRWHSDPRVARRATKVLREVGPDDTRARLALLNQQRRHRPVWPVEVNAA